VTGYLNAAIAQDWPAMEHGGASPLATRALNDAYAALLKYNPTDRRSEILLAEAIHQLDLVTQARRDRLMVASGIVPGIMGLVLFGGAILTIVFTLFFGAENLRAQTMMTAGLSVLIFSGLLIINYCCHRLSICGVDKNRAGSSCRSDDGLRQIARLGSDPLRFDA
jgi:hypothetical protein